eukprot:g8219.t1
MKAKEKLLQAKRLHKVRSQSEGGNAMTPVEIHDLERYFKKEEENVQKLEELCEDLNAIGRWDGIGESLANMKHLTTEMLNFLNLIRQDSCASESIIKHLKNKNILKDVKKDLEPQPQDTKKMYETCVDILEELKNINTKELVKGKNNLISLLDGLYEKFKLCTCFNTNDFKVLRKNLETILKRPDVKIKYIGLQDPNDTSTGAGRVYSSLDKIFGNMKYREEENSLSASSQISAESECNILMIFGNETFFTDKAGKAGKDKIFSSREDAEEYYNKLASGASKYDVVLLIMCNSRNLACKFAEKVPLVIGLGGLV